MLQDQLDFAKQFCDESTKRYVSPCSIILWLGAVGGPEKLCFLRSGMIVRCGTYSFVHVTNGLEL